MTRRMTALAALIALAAVTAAGAKPKDKPKAHPSEHATEHAHVDHGRHLALGHDKLHKFGERDREAASHWLVARGSRAPAGFRPTDLLPASLVPRVRVGSVLDHDVLSRSRKLPTELASLLPAPPSGLRYRTINGDVGLLDSADRLHDLLHLPRLPRPPGL